MDSVRFDIVTVPHSVTRYRSHTKFLRMCVCVCGGGPCQLKRLLACGAIISFQLCKLNLKTFNVTSHALPLPLTQKELMLWGRLRLRRGRGFLYLLLSLLLYAALPPFDYLLKLNRTPLLLGDLLHSCLSWKMKLEAEAEVEVEVAFK